MSAYFAGNECDEVHLPIYFEEMRDPAGSLISECETLIITGNHLAKILNEAIRLGLVVKPLARSESVLFFPSEELDKCL